MKREINTKEYVDNKLEEVSNSVIEKLKKESDNIKNSLKDEISDELNNSLSKAIDTKVAELNMFDNSVDENTMEYNGTLITRNAVKKKLAIRNALQNVITDETVKKTFDNIYNSEELVSNAEAMTELREGYGKEMVPNITLTDDIVINLRKKFDKIGIKLGKEFDIGSDGFVTYISGAVAQQVAPGEMPELSEFKLKKTNFNFHDIVVYMKISNNLLNDYNALYAKIVQDHVNAIYKELIKQIFMGTGVGYNKTGIFKTTGIETIKTGADKFADLTMEQFDDLVYSMILTLLEKDQELDELVFIMTPYLSRNIVKYRHATDKLRLYNLVQDGKLMGVNFAVINSGEIKGDSEDIQNAKGLILMHPDAYTLTYKDEPFKTELGHEGQDFPKRLTSILTKSRVAGGVVNPDLIVISKNAV